VSAPVACRRYDDPFPHVVFPDYAWAPPSTLARLLASFPPSRAFRGTRRQTGSDKTYEVNSLALHDRGSWLDAFAALDPFWQRFVRQFATTQYVAEMVQLLGIAWREIALEIRLAEYAAGGWMSRHTDRPEKLFSHIIYLCPDWLPAWGGSLALYRDARAAAPVKLVPPGPASAVAFARSERSWHSVLPVAAGAVRRTLLIHAY
jgi:Rps23 Pro-64 3,4-dihydroxylase Tpa1-like proline 4-hydroxylase